jgi:hypothetical protein
MSWGGACSSRDAAASARCGLYTVLSRKMATDVDPLLTVSLQQTAGLLWALATWPWELRQYSSDFVLGFSPGGNRRCYGIRHHVLRRGVLVLLEGLKLRQGECRRRIHKPHSRLWHRDGVRAAPKPQV